MKAKAIRRREPKLTHDRIFGAVPKFTNTDVWRVQLELGPSQYFVSSRKYANEKSARAAAKRISKD